MEWRKRASLKAGADEPSAVDSHELNAKGIILIGFMGAGKSSVGLRLAELLGWVFEDLDGRIEARERRRVPEIFRKSGEKEFRRAERTALQELLSEVQAGTPRIVALGGGAFVQGENAKLIENSGLSTVFLDADVNELWRRCCAQANRGQVERPLLNNLSDFRRLYKARQRHYERATLRLATDGKAVDQIADELAKMLKLSPGRKDPKRRNPRRRTRGERN
jgi:shikimate kinase